MANIMAWPSPPHQVRKRGFPSPQATRATPPWIQSYYIWVGWWLDNMGCSANSLFKVWYDDIVICFMKDLIECSQKLTMMMNAWLLGGLIWYQVRHFKRNSLFLQPHSLMNHKKAILYTWSQPTLLPRWERWHCLRRQELRKRPGARVPVGSPARRLLGRRNSWEREGVVCVGRETEWGNS